MIRILLVDDHNLVRKGISLLLESSPDIEVIGEAENCDEAVRKTHQLRPDIVLMDLSFPEGRNGFSAIRDIHLQYPEIGIIVLSMYDNQEYVKQAASMGVKGYLLKNGNNDQLVHAVKTVYSGELCYGTMFPLETIKAWMSEDSKKDSDKDLYKDALLTYREMEIVRMTALGYTNRQISSILTISVKTVENHKYNAMSKLNLKTKQQLVKYAMSNLLELSQ